MAKRSHKVLNPQLAIIEAVNRPGGVTRETAVSSATTRMETLRASSLEAMAAAIGEIEAMILSPNGEIPGDQVTQLFPIADRIITLAGTFGFDRLSDVAKNLCHVTACLSGKKMAKTIAIRVHIDAMRQMSPFGPGIGEVEERKILAELIRVRTHLEQGAKDN